MTVVGENTSVPASEASYAVCMDYPIVFEAAQGWQCPICKSVYAPWICECLHCGKKEFATSTWTISASPDVVKIPDVCSCWHKRPDGSGECWGTKEREQCRCNGAIDKCDLAIFTKP